MAHPWRSLHPLLIASRLATVATLFCLLGMKRRAAAPITPKGQNIVKQRVTTSSVPYPLTRLLQVYTTMLGLLGELEVQ